MSVLQQIAELRRQIEMRTVGLGWTEFEVKWGYATDEKKEIFDQKKRGNGGGSSDWVGGHGRRQSGGSAFTPEGLPPGSYLRLLVAPRLASVRRF